MPLVKQNLISSFEPFFDQESPNFISFPEGVTDVANKWADGINSYASFIVPVSSSSSISRTAFFNVMLGLTLQNGLTVLPQAFTAYAVQLGLGMVGYTATPPPIPINFVAVYSLGIAGGKNEDCLSLIADIVDIWFRTGIAVQISSGVSQPWS